MPSQVGIDIEHEDSLMSSKEGFEKAISFLKEVMINEMQGEMFWTFYRYFESDSSPVG